MYLFKASYQVITRHETLVLRDKVMCCFEGAGHAVGACSAVMARLHVYHPRGLRPGFLSLFEERY